VKVREFKTPVGDEGHNKNDCGQKCSRRQESEKSISNSFRNNTSYVKTSSTIIQ
jgi:hypothetical protein